MYTAGRAAIKGLGYTQIPQNPPLGSVEVSNAALRGLGEARAKDLERLQKALAKTRRQRRRSKICSGILLINARCHAGVLGVSADSSGAVSGDSSVWIEVVDSGFRDRWRCTDAIVAAENRAAMIRSIQLGVGAELINFDRGRHV